MGYKQLTQEQRYHIYGLLKVGGTVTFMAEEIGVNKSTVSREIKRNSGLKGYRPKQAQELTDRRRAEALKSIKMTPLLIEKVNSKIQEDWSPEQISGRLLREENIGICHEIIYQHIKDDKDQGGNLYKHLRHSRKKRKKRFGSEDRRGQLKNRKSIEQRPSIVDEKKRVGDWERDLVIGRNHKGALLTIVDRKSKITLMKKIDNKTSEIVGVATLELLKPFSAFIESITNDNGKEFADHEMVAKKLNTTVYFCHPYSSFERGINENTNGLVRQYFPKKSSFENISDEDIKVALDKLNNRPRKTLNYATPIEVFCGRTG